MHMAKDNGALKFYSPNKISTPFAMSNGLRHMNVENVEMETEALLHRSSLIFDVRLSLL